MSDAPDDPLGEWINERVRDGFIEFVERRNGIDVFRILKQLPEQRDTIDEYAVDDAVVDAE